MKPWTFFSIVTVLPMAGLFLIKLAYPAAFPLWVVLLPLALYGVIILLTFVWVALNMRDY